MNSAKWRAWAAEAIEFTAKFYRDLDFRAVWRNIIRMFEDPEVGNELEFAKYLREEVLKEQEDGSFGCLWRSGFDAVPAGYRTYVSNNQERMWRTVKGLLPKRQ